MAEGGGSGITTMPVLQSLSQARDRWNEHQASAIWDAAIVKVILGGASGSCDLQDISSLIGERDETTDSVAPATTARSNQRSIRRVPILPPDRIRRLPPVHRHQFCAPAPPIITDLQAGWPSRTDARQLSADRTEIENLLRHGRAPRPRAPTCSSQQPEARAA